jgi:Fe2+ transport system protein FeoA
MIVAYLDELRLAPGKIRSRRARIRALGITIVARKNSDALVGKLCQRLIEAGHDPGEPMEVYRDGTLSLHVRSIGEAADLTVREAGRRPPHFAKGRSFTTEQDADALEDDDL